jgi:hypothetical protein
LLAYIGFLTTVRYFIFSKVTGWTESFPTLSTCIIFYTSVKSFMYFEVLGIPKILPTFFTNIWFLFTMSLSCLRWSLDE